MAEHGIERRIVTGLIISTEYIQKIRKFWNPKLIVSSEIKKVAIWCIEYFDAYGKAPGQDIESIYFDKVKNLPQKEAEIIEEILEGVSDEYERAEKFNVQYLIDQTFRTFEENGLYEFAEDIITELEQGNLSEAKNLVNQYSSPVKDEGNAIDLSDESILQEIKHALTATKQNVLSYPRQLGEFWNAQLVRDSFVALMGPEKRGKTFMLLDMALRATKQKSKVAFFQAGDMSKDQQLIRIANYLTKKSDKEKYSGKMHQPTRDCIHNQMDTCDLEERESDFGIFEFRGQEDPEELKKHKTWIREQVTMEELKEKAKQYPEYKPCYNCPLYWKQDNKWGAAWVEEVNSGKPLKVKEAQRAYRNFFIKSKRRFKLATYPNSTLTISEIKNQLAIWERQEGFVPDLIIIDYVDILAPEIKGDPRNQENDKWAKLRGLSQETHSLVITVTQTDAKSYKKNLLSKENFTEDKRRFAHVTAMYGMNQDFKGREKKIGLMRLNELVVREGDFHETNQVTILQNLSRGQPILQSFW